jgi:DNA polymerase-3 subunit alpha
LKGVIKDFDRQFDNNFSNANLITSIIDMKDTTMLDLFRRASTEPRLKQYIKEQSDIFKILPTILNQPKTKSIHPCAMIIFPNVMEASQWCPTRMQKGLLVSEWDGYQMDEAGFLKEDILGIKQLDKFSDILILIKENNKEVPDIYNLPNDSEVFRYFGNGWNGDIFQLGSEGLTEYSKQLKPTSIDDLIAANALYRPGPMENHYHEIYIKCKNEGRPPVYLWGTESITKDTYGLIVYQEQVMEICQQLGNLTMKEADDVRRAMGKKNLEVLLQCKGMVQKGFLENGCELQVFEEIWNVLLEFAKYSFNKSHSAAYALTAYVGMYLKVHYPLEYWTVALDYADEKNTLKYLAEIFSTKKASILPPDINGSNIEMTSDMKSQNIFWGLGSIKGIGEDTAMQIISDRQKLGEYKSFANFLTRHTFTGSKVKKQTYEALISSGAFDGLYGFKNQEEKRYSLIRRFRMFKKVKIANPSRDAYTTGEITKRWWWLLKQKELTGLAYIDYTSLSLDLGIERQFCNQMELGVQQRLGIFRAFGGYVVECVIGKSKKGKYARITIENNYKIYKLVVWSEAYANFEKEINNCEKSLIIFTADLKYEKVWTKGNQFTLGDESIFKILK